MTAAGSILTAALLLGAPVQAQPLPPLPELPLETYEPAVREPVAAAYQQALESPDDAGASGFLGMVLYAQEQYEFAEACFERARAIDAGDGRWSYYLGRAQSYLARHDQAAAALREALRHRPGYLPAQVLLAQSLLDGGHLDESRALYEQLAREHPDTAEVHYGLGRIHAARSEDDAAIEQLLRACALFPEFGAAHFALARAYRNLGEKEKAREHLALYQKDKLAWPILPDPWLGDVVALRGSATDHLRKGIQLFEDGQLDEAATEHEAALEIDPKLVQAHLNLIRIYGELDRPDEAKGHYRAAIAIEPSLAEIHYNYGVLLARIGENGEAVEALEKALELNPAYAEAHNNLAYLLMISGNLEEATRHYEEALENKPDFRAAHFNLGRILVQRGEIQGAIDHFRQTLAPEDEETPRCTYALGAAYARSGEYDEALRYMKLAHQKATALGQSQLLSSIEKDLMRLERVMDPQ